jgi:hypothetical protein
MLARRLPSRLNYIKHRITNSASEGTNSQAACIIANARGLACFENLRTRIRRLSLALKKHKKPYLYRTESNARRCARSPRVNFVHGAHKLVLTVICADA